MLEGRCTCGEVRYRLKAKPLFVHCCHCRWCQRETGSAFALNALIEAEAVETVSGEPVGVTTPSESGKGQIIHRCPTCQVAVWSVYSGLGADFRFIRVGTLEDPNGFIANRIGFHITPACVRSVLCCYLSFRFRFCY